VIGLSLSFCVSDIIRGRVKESDVQLIIAGTRADNAVEMHNVLRRYADLYWSAAPEAGLAVARRLLKAGKIFQPRVYNNDAELNIANGHWLALTDDEPFIQILQSRNCIDWVPARATSWRPQV
jgi:hypothetical protein